MKLDVLYAQNTMSGIPSSSATSIVKLMKLSEIMQVTGGMPADSLSLVMILRKGQENIVLMEMHRFDMSLLVLRSDGGSPSGMV